MYFNDPSHMPKTGESPEDIFQKSSSLTGTAGAMYVERRGISLETAHKSEVRYCENFNGRAAVIVPLRDKENNIRSLHGRYLENRRHQNKMMTVGEDNGIISFLDGWQRDPVILVEGLFDALSLAQCGWPASAPIGRTVSWLPEVCKNRTVWLAFDACKPAEKDAEHYRKFLKESSTIRMLPPLRCKDWNTALVKRGAYRLSAWIEKHITNTEGSPEK